MGSVTCLRGGIDVPSNQCDRFLHLCIDIFTDTNVYGLTMTEWIDIGLMCGPSTLQKLYNRLDVDVITRWCIGDKLYKRMFDL